MSGFSSGVNGGHTPPRSTSSTVRGEYSRTESAGVGFGLSSLAGFDSENHGPMYCYEKNPLTGNAKEVAKPYESHGAESVTEKGNRMTLF